MSDTLLRDHIGSALRRHRKARGFSLRDVEARAKISIAHISDAERGNKEISSEYLSAILAALDVPLSRVLMDAAATAYGTETSRGWRSGPVEVSLS